MTTPRRTPLTRRSAARALDGTTPSGSATLDQILAAATAPATEAELGREGAALTLFQQGRQATAHRAAGVGLRARIATARVAVAGVAVAFLVGGGVAIAAGVGPGDGLFHAPQDKPSYGATPGAPGSPTSKPGADSPGTPVQSYSGLCRAFQAEALTNGDVASSPSFAALADDAGGQDKIKKYCQDLLGTPTGGPSGPPTGLPTQAADPTQPSRPTSAADPTQPVIPTPTAKPTQPPVPTPTASPTRTHPGGGKPTKTPTP